MIETACAHVFLGPQSALKMKRHKDLGYVDFSTAERRLWALERELEFNRTAAPDIYRAVRRITREAGVPGTAPIGPVRSTVPSAHTTSLRGGFARPVRA